MWYLQICVYTIKLRHHFNNAQLYLVNVSHATLLHCTSISSDSLSKHMDTGQQKLWSSRADKLIVLVDSESKSVDTAGKTSLPVIILKDTIYKV